MSLNDASFSIVCNIVADIRRQLDDVLDLITCREAIPRGRCTKVTGHDGLHINASGDGW